MSLFKFETRGPKKPGAGRKLASGIFLVLFALPFAGFGTFAAVKSVEAFLKGNIREGLLAGVFALCFGGVGSVIILGVIFGGRVVKRQGALEKAHPDKPWLWREDWAKGRIPSHSKAGMFGAWGIAIFWNLVSSGIFFVLPKEMAKGNKLALIGLVFPVIGVGLIWMAALATSRWFRFGQSAFVLFQNPGTIGGQLAGHIETSRKVRARDGVHLTLRCTRRDSSGENTHTHMLWQEDKIIVKDLLDDPRCSRIPVFFNIPADCASTDSSNEHAKTIWQLEARAKISGPDYVAQFEVPVFKTGEPIASLKPAIDPTLGYQTAEKPWQRPANSRIRVGRSREGGMEFHFPSARNAGPLLFLTVMTTIWTGAVWFMWILHAPIFFPIVFGIVNILLILGMITAFFRAQRITVDPHRLRAESLWRLFRIRKEYSGNEISSISPVVGMTVGTTMYYDLKLFSSDGRKHVLASSVKDKREAEWLCREMLGALKLDKPASSHTITA